uniref:Salivary protein 15 Iper-1 n=1 Tax=Ixodes persulcatus TaxID=34615 RepID=SP151_IXOPE|nr:RecName: Full=Salivary protein 15 Iper-1; Short=Salp15 Iper-1; AltName: Full=Salp15-like; Flags: Precursor [Ixodes persulcatus]BAH09310.1 secreted salivary protein Salp15 precursor Iper-1 [Ixodes persulcatus]
MESFVAMKVVCILFLFVVAAEAASTKESPAVNPSKGKDRIKFNFPRYVPNHHVFASNLLKLCTEYTPETQARNDGSQATYKPRINDLQVNFKNCTFLCKREFGNVTLNLPVDTPCGPNKQTCADKSKCVGHIPGC